MQIATNLIVDYREIFNFSLTQPLVKFKKVKTSFFLDACFQMDVYPITTIKDPQHPLYISAIQQVPPNLREDIDCIVLSISYNEEFLA